MIAKQPKVAAKLLAELKARYESMTPGEAAVAKLDQAAFDAISKLGYVGGTTRTTDEFLTEGLPDPKDHTELLNKFKVAQAVLDRANNAQEAVLALPIFQAIIQESPNSRVFHFMLGVCALKAEQPLLAQEAFRYTIKLDPNSASPLNAQASGLLAEALLELGRSDEALEHLALALKIDEQNPELHFRYAELLRRQNRTDEAVPHYERAIELFPAFAAARAGLVVALAPSLESGNFEKAIPELEQAIERRPRNSDLHFRLAMLYAKAGKNSEAVTHFREVLKIKPDHGEALLQLGITLDDLGRTREAEEVLRQALTRAEVAADAYYALCILLSNEEKSAEAVEMCEKCIELKPANSLALEKLTAYYMGEGRFKDAIRVLKIGAEKVPANVTFLNMLAKLLATSGDAKLRDGPAAVTLASKASQLTQDRQPSVLSTLAAAYAESGDFPRAIETARKAVQLAEEAQQSELAAAIRSQLDGYLKNQPYRDPRL